MQTHGGDYKDLVVFLAAAGVMVPLVNRLKISPVLGFLAAGVVLGPDGLARFADSPTGVLMKSVRVRTCSDSFKRKIWMALVVATRQ